ncbi:alpha/beta hydrolase [Pusillimonas sp.]|uniref:alpha/beta fold hydrolase n=1 Tax=Pusillimonas sp. TaxID=3040095 RepID=UPI0029B19C1C|nr:alpha/beta hydrolase [Pusillimonas sp.]MDX3893094.1 alpha/beta hydrolase [Pusillimonas sp.]
MASGTAQSLASGMPPAASGFAENTVRVKDGVLGYRETGSGRHTIVLLHGISSGSASWSECAAVLGRRARVIAWDAPGYGASTPLPHATPAAPHYAARIDDLLEALGVEQCLLVGHSLGALMAAAYSGLPHHRADRFVLMSPALGYGARGEQARQVRDKRLAALRDLGIEGMARNLPDRLLTGRAGEAARETVRGNALRLRPEGYAQAVELLCGDDIDRYTPPVEATRVYCGEHDVVTTPRQSREYAQRHGFPFALIAGAGHACYVEQPEAVAACISEALAEPDAPGRTKT